MASDIHQKHGQSLFIPPAPPVLRRERSYSLPPGLALMSAEEATMIFSAAERATSRRRRVASVDASLTVERPVLVSGSNSSVASPEASPMTPQNESGDRATGEDRVAVGDADHHPNFSNFSWGTETTTKAILRSTEPFPSFPLVPASPTSPRRPATSPQHKTYADGLYEFTRSRLTTAVAPRFRIDSVTSDERPNRDQAPSAEPAFRPMLKSHFSDWSIPALSRQGSQAVMPNPLDEVDCPDTLFDFDFLAVAPGNDEASAKGFTYASSEALASSSTLPPPTPPTHARSGDEEISYFSNFERLHESPKQPPRRMRRTKPVIFTLSPMPSPRNSIIRDGHEPDVEPSSSTNGGAVQDGDEDHSARLETARLAVRVPHVMIGAVL